MLFNLVSGLSEASRGRPERFCSYNEVVAYCLGGALEHAGHDVQYVSCGNLCDVPCAEHTIVIAAKSMLEAKNNPGYLGHLRDVTCGRLMLWLDSDFGSYHELFDRVLVVNRRSSRLPESYRFVGWAADEGLFRSEQSGNHAYVDAFLYGLHPRDADVFDCIKEALGSVKTPYTQLVAEYNAGRVSWFRLAAAFRKATHYVLTGPGYWSLTNIEAATCGALLVVHEKLHKPDTFPAKLNVAVYSSADELRGILAAPVDLEANRRLAMENSWSKVAARVVEAAA